MIITYKFDNGDTSEFEVSEEIGTFIIESRRKEDSGSKKEHRHCYSLDNVLYEGQDFGTTDEYSFENSETTEHIQTAFSNLSEIQKQRLLMLASGMSIREIARREGKNYRSVYESIEAAKKKFIKHF